MIHAVIDGTTYYVADVSVKYNICDSSGTAEFYVHPSSTITAFSDVNLVVDGESIYKGYVDRVTKVPGKGVLVACDSYLLRANRTWFKDEYVSEGENTTFWSNHFFNMSGVPSYTIENYAVPIPEAHAWGFMTCFEALKNIAQITDSKIYPDRHGVIHMKPMSESGVVKTITYYEHMETDINSDTIRTRAVVWGQNCMAEETQSSPYVTGSRTTAISTGLIETESAARALAQKILRTFRDPMYIRSFVIDGDATLSLNDYVSTPRGDGAITALEHSYNAEKFITTVTIGHICPDFYGIAKISPPLYLSTYLNGVWKSDDGGSSWYDISGVKLANKTVPAIHWDGNTYLWAVSENGIYRSPGNSSWVTCNIEDSFSVSFEEDDYTVDLSNVTFVDVITDYNNGYRVFALGYDEVNEHTVVIISEDQYNFDRIYMV